MEHNDNHNSVAEKVLAAIEQKKLVMKPRWQFVLSGLVYGFGLFLLALGVLYAVTFSIFIMRENGSWFAPEFGLKGIWVFLFSIPLLFVGVALAFLLLLEILVRKYSFAYKRPMLYSLLALTVLVFLGSLAVDSMSVHEKFYKQASDGNLPLAGKLYELFSIQDRPHTYVGVIVDLPNPDLVIQSHYGKKVYVVVTSDTKMPNKVLGVGDYVSVFGSEDDGKIQAFGVKFLMDNRVRLAPPRMHR